MGVMGEFFAFTPPPPPKKKPKKFKIRGVNFTLVEKFSVFNHKKSSVSLFSFLANNDKISYKFFVGIVIFVRYLTFNIRKIRFVSLKSDSPNLTKNLVVC